MPRTFVNGQVFDGLHYLGRRAVTVDEGRVVGIGDDATARKQADGEAVDLQGGLLVPGFQDAHMHPMVGGLERLRCEMTDLSTRDEYLAAISEHLESRPDTEWFRAGGWSTSAFGAHGPTAEDLDSVVPDRPAFIPSSDHHNAWVNTRALQVAGITAQTADPPDGWFERDEHGAPTGTIREAAIAMVGDHVTTSREENHRALLEAQRYLHSLGVTGWHDALIGGYAGIDDPTQAYLDAIETRSLTARVRASMWWDRHRGVEQLEGLRERRRLLRDAGLDAGSVKIMMDGIAETFTAAVGEPYVGETGCPCGDKGLAFMSRAQVEEAVRALDGAGFAVHFHAIGDRAVHDALDAVEQARRVNGMNDNRHQIAHLQLVRPADRRRFRELGVVANLEGMWASAGTPAVQILLPHLDEERIGWHYPFADIAGHGAMLAGGSDWPVNPADPVSAIHVLVNRRPYAPDGPDQDPLRPEQALSLAQAMAAYTHGSAYVNHRVDVGNVQIGARADLAVLDKDPFAGDSAEIGSAQVVAAYVDGETVHEA